MVLAVDKFVTAYHLPCLLFVLKEHPCPGCVSPKLISCNFVWVGACIKLVFFAFSKKPGELSACLYKAVSFLIL